MIKAWDALGPPGVALAVFVVAAVAWAALQAPAAPEMDDCLDWAPWVWLSVALLPIAWISSLLPLLPWLVLAVLRGRLVTRILAATALALPFGPVPFTADSGAYVATVIGASGLAFATGVAFRHAARAAPRHASS
jgi:hypothetical protein